MTAGRRLELVVTAEEVGERVDRVCAARLAGEAISRSSIVKICDAGGATIGGGVVKASTRVRLGDRIALEVPEPEPATAVAQQIPLTILYEDDALLVIDKPAGLVVHPARGHASGTLVNAVLHHATIERDAAGAPLRPGIVHRLDKGTSGVLVVAKTAAAREALKVQFQAHTIERSYVALTQGVPPREVTYDTLHGRHRTQRMLFTSRVREGKRAVTHVQLVEPLARGHAAHVRCRLETGRTHQIRMHLSEAGFPILGDPLYGRAPREAVVRDAIRGLDHQALHAEVLGFAHPTDARSMRFTSPPPRDFQAALEALRRV